MKQRVIIATAVSVFALSARAGLALVEDFLQLNTKCRNIFIRLSNKVLFITVVSLNFSILQFFNPTHA